MADDTLDEAMLARLREELGRHRSFLRAEMESQGADPDSDDVTFVGSFNFSRSGVDGHIMLEPKDLHVHAKLGFLTAMFKEPIESEIKRVLKEKF